MTALDTNILIDLLSGSSQAYRERAQRIILTAAQHGPLVLSPIVFAELGAHPSATSDSRDQFLRDLRITIQWALPESVWRLAGERFGEYAVRRRHSAGTEPRRLIADFVIGAHAAIVGRLATRDAAFYQKRFPEVVVIDGV